MKQTTITLIVSATALAVAWLMFGRYRYDTTQLYQTRTDRLTSRTEVIFYFAGGGHPVGQWMPVKD
jgi:hypothetical protein